MLRFIIVLLFSLQLSGQILKPDLGMERLITSSTIQLNEKFFRVPLFQQPVVLIKYSPLYPRILGITREISSGWFIIDLNPIYSEYDLEETLIHELVHVKQIWSGDLKKVREGFIWKGKLYPFTTEYMSRPWEVEAFEEVKLICD